MRAAAWLRALVTRTVALVPAILVATLSSGALPHLHPNRIKSKQSSWNTIKSESSDSCCLMRTLLRWWRLRLQPPRRQVYGQLAATGSAQQSKGTAIAACRTCRHVALNHRVS